MFTKKFLICIFALVILILSCSCSFADDDEWICSNCGTKNNANFCTNCGNKRPEEIICPNCGEKYSLSSGIRFCGKCGAKLQSDTIGAQKYEGEGFNTPEEAVLYYLNGLKNFDIEQMLKAFAWETKIKRLSVEKFYDRMGAYIRFRGNMPSKNKFLFSVNINQSRADIINEIYRAVDFYIIGKNEGNSAMVSFNQLKRYEEIKTFVQNPMWNKIEKISKLSNIKFLSPDDVLKNKFNEKSLKRFYESLAKSTGYYCADEVVNIFAIADVEDEKLIYVPTVARYGNEWYIISNYSLLSGFLNLPAEYHAFFCGKELAF